MQPSTLHSLPSRLAIDAINVCSGILPGLRRLGDRDRARNKRCGSGERRRCDPPPCRSRTRHIGSGLARQHCHRHRPQRHRRYRPPACRRTGPGPILAPSGCRSIRRAWPRMLWRSGFQPALRQRLDRRAKFQVITRSLEAVRLRTGRASRLTGPTSLPTEVDTAEASSDSRVIISQQTSGRPFPRCARETPKLRRNPSRSPLDRKGRLTF